MFACRSHYYLLPQFLRDSLWAAYRPGQEVTKKVSGLYILVQRRCVYEIAQKEGRPEAAAVAKEIGDIFRGLLSDESPDKNAADTAHIAGLDEALKRRFSR